MKDDIDKKKELALKRLAEIYEGTGDPKEEYRRLMESLDEVLKPSRKTDFDKKRYYYDQGEHEEPEEPKISKFASLFSIWFRPRETIRSMINSHPFWSVLVLPVTSNVLSSLLITYVVYFYLDMFLKFIPEFSTLPYITTIISFPRIYVYGALIPLGVIISLLSLYIRGALYALIGRWLGGQGKSREIRVVLAWSNIPAIAFILIGWVIVFINTQIYGDMSLEEMRLISTSGGPTIFMCGIRILGYVIIIWSFIIFIVGLSEGHRFSKWRAFSSVLIVGILLSLIAFILLIILILPFAIHRG